MSVQLATRVLHVKDGNSYDTIDILRGDDGVSPTATVSKSGSTATITITDKNGTTTAQVNDGSDATVTVDSQLSGTSTNPVQNKVIKSALDNVVPKTATDAEIGSTTQIKNYGDQLKLSYSDSQGLVDVQLGDNNLLVYAEEGNAQNLLNFGSNGTYIRNVVTPTSAGDAVPKSYVDTRVAGIANAYSASSTYAVGDYVTHNGNVYRCTTAITTAEVWTAAHWTQVTIGDELSQTNEDITELSGSIAPVESSTTATAAHAVGELFLVGETLMVALSAIAVGDTITTEGSTPNAAVTKLTDKLLKDVQVNGTSVVNQGVANVPLANGNSTYGAISGFSDRGIVVENGKPKIWTASANQIKSSSSQYHPITPANQNASTFYGLAKAASDTTQSASSNPVGQYTDAAKVAIQKMLGIYEAPWELIRRDTFTNATEADYTISVDDNGQTFELTDLVLMFETPTQETASAKSGQVRLYMNNGSTAIRHEPGGWTQAASGNAHGIIIVARQHDGFMESFHSVQNTTGNAENLRYEYYGGNSFVGNNATGGVFLISETFTDNNAYFTSVLLQKVTGTGRYSLYGKRKWS